MGLFDFNIAKMLSGDEKESGGGGGGFIMNMLMKQMSAPGTQKMITGKAVEMFDFLAGSVKATRDDVSLLLKIEKLPVKNEQGDHLIETGQDGIAVQQFEDKLIAYVMVAGKAVQKIEASQFLAMMSQQNQEGE
jgi:hypothetical protein